MCRRVLLPAHFKGPDEECLQAVSGRQIATRSTSAGLGLQCSVDIVDTVDDINPALPIIRNIP